MKFLILLGIAMLVIPFQSNAQSDTRTGSLCVVKSSSYVVHRGEPNFPQAARDLNAFFSATKSSGSLLAPSRIKFADENTEVIRIDSDVMQCMGNGQPDVGVLSIGGCDYVGCVGSVPHEFHDLPSGSTVTMSSCGGGVRTSGSFQKQSNGLWVMKSYSTEQVTQCDPMG